MNVPLLESAYIDFMEANIFPNKETAFHPFLCHISTATTIILLVFHLNDCSTLTMLCIQ